MLITVIIPTCNRAGYLQQAIESVFSQSLPCSELLVIDDGSTDDTVRLVERLASSTSVPVRLFCQENQGVACARNHGVRMARGRFIAFLDSDDRWLPEKLAVQMTAMQAAPHLLISHTRELWFRRDQRVNQKKKYEPPHGDIFLRSLNMCVVGMSTVLVRRELFDRYGLFDESLPCCEDYDLWLRVGSREPFLLVPEALTCKYGGRSDQLSTIHRAGMDVYRIRSLCHLLDAGGLTFEQRHAAVAELTRKCRIYGQGCLKRGRVEEGQEYFDLAAGYHQEEGSR
ncbi:glycosyltransferase family 2 protein [Desulfobulbus oligotrophicus]|jgi:glycosyltransferase involved in cell wall biosynthesis|uniref:Glycosyltransferase family 2 protein n=1 Tax=Desulfobulbus oligotrophicus TaxID=1909699 RepID=A0A7T6ARQ1_9BACT|nr:glycosyltransferase family A protein [Desulfobulbus oligotrophicus]MDY0389961.1 glycosyltransferase family A protein [Desulfobulbus oligotrophicus]QQG66783.1 glycosyltransferase family 2 protein [Desulfobulbus oligotrophicus]